MESERKLARSVIDAADPGFKDPEAGNFGVPASSPEIAMHAGARDLTLAPRK